MNLTVLPKVQPRLLTSATCPGCGCVCDDLTIEVENGSARALTDCSLAQQWFSRSSDPAVAALVDGRPADVDRAVAMAASLLKNASRPLIFGMGQTSCEAQREAVGLAETLGAVVDSHTSLMHAGTKMAGQLMGKVTCTLGEVMNRADFVAYWGCDPSETHPRHPTRYSLTRHGKFTPEGRRGRTLLVADVRETPLAREADVFLRVPPGRDFEILSTLRAMVKGERVDFRDSDVSLEELRSLAERMKRARFGVFFYGSGLTSSRGRHLNVSALLTLTRELNAFAKFATMPMRPTGNEAGADNVFSWLTGFPFGVDFSRGFPRYNPGEFTAEDLLERGDVDAALVIGADPSVAMARSVLEKLAAVPTVVLDPQVTPLSRRARVHITTAAFAVEVGGTAYRMDKVPMPVRACVPTERPSDEAILRRIASALSPV